MTWQISNLSPNVQWFQKRLLFSPVNTEKVGTFGLRKNDILALGDCDEHAERSLTLCGWAIIAADAEDEE